MAPLSQEISRTPHSGGRSTGSFREKESHNTVVAVSHTGCSAIHASSLFLNEVQWGKGNRSQLKYRHSQDETGLILLSIIDTWSPWMCCAGQSSFISSSVWSDLIISMEYPLKEAFNPWNHDFESGLQLHSREKPLSPIGYRPHCLTVSCGSLLYTPEAGSHIFLSERNPGTEYQPDGRGWFSNSLIQL